MLTLAPPFGVAGPASGRVPNDCEAGSSRTSVIVIEAVGSHAQPIGAQGV